jgi:hypothetical protein
MQPYRAQTSSDLVGPTDMRPDCEPQPEPLFGTTRNRSRHHLRGAKWGSNRLPTRWIRAPELSRPDEIMTMATAVSGSSNLAAPVCFRGRANPET